MMKRYGKKKQFVFFLLALVMFFPSTVFPDEKPNLAGISVEAGQEKASRTITYYGNKTTTVPYEISRIASGWPAQNSIIAMLGYGDKIVATHDLIKANPIFTRFVPTIRDASGCFTSSGEINIESITQARPDVIFIPSTQTNSDQLKRLEDMGMSVAYLKANSLQNMVDRTVITGQILGDDAYRRALQYRQYYNRNVQITEQRISKIPEDKRLRVYHCLGNPLMTQGAPSLVQDWMDMAGVINIARNWSLMNLGQSGCANINLEQIIGADPEVIVCMNPKDADVIKTDPAWSVIKAVKQGKVYINPKGLFWWCRETTEEALQFLWLAKTVYPDYLKDIDMTRETRYFYKTFYGLNLTDKDIELFLSPK